jgi:hypothetical protein
VDLKLVISKLLYENLNLSWCCQIVAIARGLVQIGFGVLLKLLTLNFVFIIVLSNSGYNGAIQYRLDLFPNNGYSVTEFEPVLSIADRGKQMSFKILLYCRAMVLQ